VWKVKESVTKGKNFNSGNTTRAAGAGEKRRKVVRHDAAVDLRNKDAIGMMWTKTLRKSVEGGGH